MDARMRSLNARLRAEFPQGYALDDQRVPHVTLVQRYVRGDRLGETVQAIEHVLAGTALPRDLFATGYDFNDSDAFTTVSVAVERTAVLESLQAALVHGIAPFAMPEGDSDAFVRDAGEAIEQSTIEYVRDFVPRRTGHGFEPHITAGRCARDDARQLQLERFTPVRFGVAGAAVYQLGNAGTARRRTRFASTSLRLRSSRRSTWLRGYSSMPNTPNSRPLPEHL